MQTSTLNPMQTPSRLHILGTDQLGRDILSRLLYGTQHTLFVALLSTSVAVIPGLLLGVSAGMAKGWVDRFITILVNALLAFPSLIFALVILSLLGQGSWQLALATGGAQIALYARITRSATLSIINFGFIESAQAIGVSKTRLMLRYILPNAQPTLIGYGGLVFSYSMINSAALSFLGLGGEPGLPDWGVMLAEGREAFRIAPWVSLAPGLAITLTVWAVHTLVDRLIQPTSL
ncbi:MAG: ABC transporter permease [Chitinophagaceae bacterium]|nr:ABC transporter permease [Anaerolineae bacterium]